MGFIYIVSKIFKKMHLPAIKNSKIDKKAKICSGSHIVSSRVMKYSYIGNFCTVINCDIGKFCSIADNCIIGGASHPINWVSSSPVFHNGRNILKKNFSEHKYETSEHTTIGNDVWIGSNCLIKSGVNIGNGAVIGMGSVVTKDIAPYEIWAGNPARFIRKRFDDDIIKQINEMNWWDWEDEILKQVAPYFNNIENLLDFINQRRNNP